MSIVDKPSGINKNIMSMKEKRLTFSANVDEPFKE
jgi:hypothetical protein